MTGTTYTTTPLEAHRARLRALMNLAWSLYRSEPTRGFADCLRGAWAFHKRMTVKAARMFGGRSRVVQMGKSPIHSPTSRATSGARYGRADDRRAGRSIARVGG